MGMRRLDSERKKKRLELLKDRHFHLIILNYCKHPEKQRSQDGRGSGIQELKDRTRRK